jgi:Endonuclease/Exonuclease/phosphatase family
MCAAIGVVALVAVAVGLAVPAATDARARFFHFNACGSKCAHGLVEPVVRAIEGSILDFRPHAVSLNEMCWHQFRWLRRRLRATAWRMRGRFVVTKRGGSFCGHRPGQPQLYGNAVLTRSRITSTRRWRLPDPDGTEVRKLLCVQARLLRRRGTRVCTTHISPEGGVKKRRQVRKVARTVRPWVRGGRPVALMGDFNLQPRSRPLGRIYGTFREVDEGRTRCRCGESTSGDRKIDYVFLSARHFSRRWGDATHSDISDHDPRRGKAARRRG